MQYFRRCIVDTNVMEVAQQFSSVMAHAQKRKTAEIVRAMQERLRRYIRRRVRSESDAEDVLQEVWFQLVTALDSGPIERIGAWLYTVARNRIIDRHRRPAPTSLDAPVFESDEEDGTSLGELILRDERTPATELTRGLFWEHLHRALWELPPEQRQVFVWHELEDLSFREIAELTGENQNTLLSRKRYAVLHLRRRLQDLRAEFSSHNRPSQSP